MAQFPGIGRDTRRPRGDSHPGVGAKNEFGVFPLGQRGGETVGFQA
jgi:hypothetical protein